MTRVAWNKGITKHKPKPCLCGCGEFVQVHKYPKSGNRGFTYLVNSFIKSHAKRDVGGFNPKIHTPQLCECGCGALTKQFKGRFNRFLKGHENIGRIAWNKGKSFSEISRGKMRIARLGKEPANKIQINADELYRLYVLEKRNISEVSQILGIPKDAIKNRLREFGWTRSTRESCSTDSFKEQMRQIRIRALTSQEAIESPNRLESLVYGAIDQLGIPYQKQVALFDKFVVDALFPQRLLVLEIHGRYWHQRPEIKKKDYSKRRYLEKCGYRVEEVWDYEINRHKDPSVFLRKIFTKYHLL